MNLPDHLRLSEEVRDALTQGRGVVALESSVWCQGLPRPLNFETAQEMEAQVRLAGAVPALLWLEQGEVRCGASVAELERLCADTTAVKVGAGDLPGALASNKLGATTVSASLALADRLGIRTFATGGIGGVHRDWTAYLDISSDLRQLGRTRCLTVCAGAKSVLDISTTLEQLESLAVPLITFRTDNFPEFYSKGKKAPFGTRLEEAGQVAQAYRFSLDLLGRAPLVVQSVPEEYAIASQTVEAWVAAGTEAAQQKGVTGKALTPFLLGYLAEQSSGQTLDANRVLLLHNAHLAGQIAVELATATPASGREGAL
jgi:pseudouridine-5'-phosphate glycosidase